MNTASQPRSQALPDFENKVASRIRASSAISDSLRPGATLKPADFAEQPHAAYGLATGKLSSFPEYEISKVHEFNAWITEPAVSTRRAAGSTAMLGYWN